MPPDPLASFLLSSALSEFGSISLEVGTGVVVASLVGNVLICSPTTTNAVCRDVSRGDASKLHGWLCVCPSLVRGFV